MITESIIITSIICVTVLIICFLIGYYTNKESKEQKIKDARSIISRFRESYCKYDKSENCYIYFGDEKEIMNFICNLDSIINN